jgi:hypothetical protein
MMFGGKQVVVCGYGEVKFNLSLNRCLKCILLKYSRIFCKCKCKSTFMYYFRWGGKNL